MLNSLQGQSSISRLYTSPQKMMSDPNKANQNNQIATQASEEQVSISDAGYIKSLSERYDVKNMSSKDMSSLASDLYSHHMITAFEKSAMSIQIKTPGGTFDENTKHDFRAQWEYQLSFAQQSNNASNLKIHEDVCNILNRLSEARDS